MSFAYSCRVCYWHRIFDQCCFMSVTQNPVCESRALPHPRLKLGSNLSRLKSKISAV